MKSHRALFVGLTTVDLIYFVEDVPGRNQKIRANSLRVDPGGPAYNAARAFARLGGKAVVQSLIGAGAFSGLVNQENKQLGIQLTDFSPDPASTLPIATILLTPDGDRTVISQARADGGKILDLPAQPWQQRPGIVLVDGHYPTAALPVIKSAREAGIPVVMDGGSWKAHTADLLPFVDILICSADFHLPESCGDNLWDFARQAGVSHLAVTHGGDPVEYQSDTVKLSIPVPQVEVVNTLGAGDVFHGAFCWFFLQNQDVPESLRLAGEVAAKYVSSEDRRSSG